MLLVQGKKFQKQITFRAKPLQFDSEVEKKKVKGKVQMVREKGNNGIGKNSSCIFITHEKIIPKQKQMLLLKVILK